MKSAALAMALALLGCASRPATVERPTKLVLEMICRGAGKTTDDSMANVITPRSSLELTADYALADFELATDRIAIVIDRAGDPPLRLREYSLTQASGRLKMRLTGAELMSTGLQGPFQLRLRLDRWEAGTRLRTIQVSNPMTMQAIPAAGAREDKQLPPGVGRGQLVSDMVSDPRYRPHIPLALMVPGARYWGLFKVCVDAQGAVHSVTMLKSAHPYLDEPWMDLIRTLEHRPYTLDGRPTPFCYPLRLEVRAPL